MNSAEIKDWLKSQIDAVDAEIEGIEDQLASAKDERDEIATLLNDFEAVFP